MQKLIGYIMVLIITLFMYYGIYMLFLLWHMSYKSFLVLLFCMFLNVFVFECSKCFHKMFSGILIQIQFSVMKITFSQ